MPEPNVTVSESVELAAEATDMCGELCARPAMKHSDTKDSISSVDSDVSLSYDSGPVVAESTSDDRVEDDDPAEAEDEEGANLADQSDTGSEEGGVTEKDSGCEGLEKTPKEEKTEEESPFVAPDDEQVEKIIAQVEFYFSDVNITKDAFLLKHVKRNKEGYVSLKLISSFKRVKHIAKDWRVVAYALAKSKRLEINEAGTKLRRVDPLPAYDQTTPSRTVVAIDLPLEKPTIENVAEMFRTCGEIALIRILRPGNPIPADVRHFVNKHPEMNGTVSALVEFVRTESAHNAINRQDWDWRSCEHSGMKVIELNAPPSADRKKRTQATKKNPVTRLFDSEYSSSCASGSEAEDLRYRMRMQRRCSSPHVARQPGDHWTQRRWSRDSGSDSPGSSFSRSRSNSGVFFVPDHVRRMSAGWDSGSDSYGSSRSRSNSGVSIPDNALRRFSLQSKDSECCCCGHYQERVYCRDSGSEGYGSNRSRCNSGASDIKRKDSGEYYCPSSRFIQPDRRVSVGKEPEGPYCPRPRANSAVAIQDPVTGRRISLGDSDSGKVGFQRQRSNNGIHLPENIVRMPRGPDGGRGFVAPPPACHTLVE